MGAAVTVTRREFTPSRLRSAACASGEPAQVRRLLAIALILEGAPRRRAAEQCGIDRQTLRGWVHRYTYSEAATFRKNQKVSPLDYSTACKWNWFHSNTAFQRRSMQRADPFQSRIETDNL